MARVVLLVRIDDDLGLVRALPAGALLDGLPPVLQARELGVLKQDLVRVPPVDRGIRGEEALLREQNEAREAFVCGVRGGRAWG